MTKRALAIALLATIGLAACGGSSNDASAPKVSSYTKVKNAALPTTPRSTSSSQAPNYVMQTSPLSIPQGPSGARASTTTATNPPTTSTSTTTTSGQTPRATTPFFTANTTCTICVCDINGPCEVGQKGPAGGIVFYVAPTPQWWGRYMEVLPEAFEQIVPDTCNLSAYDTYAAGRIGDGIKQTNAVIAACAKDGKPAAAGSYARVDGYRNVVPTDKPYGPMDKPFGYDDWFIPSKDELQEIVKVRAIKFATDKDLTSGTWATKPKDPANRGFDVLWGVKKEVIAGTAASSRGGILRNVEIMSDGSQSDGNPNNRWGWIYIARAFGPKA